MGGRVTLSLGAVTGCSRPVLVPSSWLLMSNSGTSEAWLVHRDGCGGGESHFLQLACPQHLSGEREGSVYVQM